MGELLIGIDVGTYSTKGVLCTPDGTALAEVQTEHGLSVPRPDWAEHDADAVRWADTCAVSRELLARSGIGAGDVAAVVVSALGADLVPLDATCARPTMTSIAVSMRTVQGICTRSQCWAAAAPSQRRCLVGVTV